MAEAGARHFYSIVVIDFIMSDAYEARPRTQARVIHGEKARGRAGGPDGPQTRSRPAPPEPKLGATAGDEPRPRPIPVVIAPGFIAVPLSGRWPRPLWGRAGLKRILGKPSERWMREANQGNGWDPCRG